ncbi:MAG: DUF4105 domain-containing protein [Deltaproteobacteria bacterium]|nr:DUF4105 domain-containing protein [Deltaproteobacteria bacterium]
MLSLCASVLLATFAQSEVADEPNADDAPRIDLITMGSGGAVYSMFGHGAVRVVTADGQDLAYNFGYVEMAQPHFWWRVLQGHLEARLEVTPYSELLMQYAGEDRTITGRTLAFSPAEAGEVARRLDAIAKSPSRGAYRYHHLLDNCTTRPVRLFDEVLGGALTKAGQYPVAGTYRERVLAHMRDRPWLYLAMDLAGSGMSDTPLSAWDATFMPEGVENLLDHARIHDEPFVRHTYVDYTSLNFDGKERWDWPWTKVYLFFLVPMFILTLALPSTRAALGLRGLAFGLVGVAHIAFWLGSDYEFYHQNWNLLLFPPVELALAYWSLRASTWRRRADLVGRYLQVHLAVAATLTVLVALGIIQQAIEPMLALALPMTGAAVFRTGIRALLSHPSVREDLAPAPDAGG